MKSTRRRSPDAGSSGSGNTAEGLGSVAAQGASVPIADASGPRHVAASAASESPVSSPTELVSAESRYRHALEAAQAGLARAQALYKVSSALAASETVETLLQRLVDAVADALPADRVNLFAIDDAGRDVVGNYRGGPGGGPIADLDFDEMMEGLAGWVLEHRAATLSPGDRPDPRESDRVRARRISIGHGPLMIAPIIYGAHRLGVVVATNQIGQREFDQTDLELLAAMADQSAVSIESAATREQLRSARDELEERVAKRTAELAQSEERFRRITETITDYIYTVEIADGRAVATRHGPGSVAVTGYSPAEFDADECLWLDMVVPEDRQLVLDQAADIESNHRMRPIEHRIVRKDGAVRWVRSTPVPQFSADGLLAGYDGLLADVTERRTLEEQLVQAQKLQSIGRLAGGVAHDFNNLLTAILGNAELALMDLPPNNPARESVDEIVKAAEGAARLTRQLLAFARKQMIEPVPLNLSQVVGSSLELVRRLIGEDIEVSAVLDERIWIVDADPGQIQQLLVNLTVNARDAMPDGGTLVIETANELINDEYCATHPDVTPGRYVSLAVTDTGTGMTEEAMGHLFEPFFTTKPQGKGTGLGLATCHGIVKQSLGHIWVHSELGQGTTVRILLPEARSGAQAVLENPVAVMPANGTETVLVVEDDPSVRRLAVLGLRSHGYVVLEAPNAVEALEIAADAHILDLLVSDVVMPVMRGPELAGHVRAIRPAAKLLLMSGHADTEEAFRDADGRPIQLLPKPFTPERLARKVREVLDAD